MLATLGFLAANLIWLLALPAISRRADRLARRRAELTFPLSIGEVSAERDHLRAQFALKQRELERSAEAGFAARAGALSEIGARDRTIASLKAVIDDRDVSIAGLGSELEATARDLSATRERLAEEERAHAQSRADLAVRGQALTERDADIAALRVERADLTATLGQRVSELAEARARADGLAQELNLATGELRQLRAEHEALGGEKDRLRILLAESETVSMARASEIADLQDRLARLRRDLSAEQAGHQETRSALEGRNAAYAALDAERDSLASRLRAAEDRIQTMQAHMKSLGTDKQVLESRLIAARQEIERANELIRAAHADHARLDMESGTQRRERDIRIEALTGDLAEARAELKAARAERAEARRELAALRRGARDASDRLGAENEALRAEIKRVGEMFLAARPGGGEAIVPPEHIANRPKRPARLRPVAPRAAE